MAPGFIYARAVLHRGAGPAHLDLFVTGSVSGNNNNRTLKTFQIQLDLYRPLFAGRYVDYNRIDDHRLIYLYKQGKLTAENSTGRGRITEVYPLEKMRLQSHGHKNHCLRLLPGCLWLPADVWL